MNSIKKAAVSTKCLAGVHGGEFKPAVGKPACNMEKTCPDCRQHLEKINHTFGEVQYEKDNSCKVIAVCVYCQKESRKEDLHHEWYTDTSRDATYRFCLRCGLEDHQSSDSFTEWPEDISELTNLTKLILNGKSLTELPKSIGQLTNLVKLNLEDTSLTKLPESTIQLVNLRRLELKGSSLNRLPKGVRQLPELKIVEGLSKLSNQNT